jgi:hypothetical protein
MQASRPHFTCDHLPPELSDRVAKLLGMLGSSHDGEVLNAARMADRAVRDAGLTWTDALQPTLPGPKPTQRPPVAHWRPTCRRLLERPHDLNPWERDFVRGIEHAAMLSVKQHRCLRSIVERVDARRAAA